MLMIPATSPTGINMNRGSPKNARRRPGNPETPRVTVQVVVPWPPVT